VDAKRATAPKRLRLPPPRGVVCLRASRPPAVHGAPRLLRRPWQTTAMIAIARFTPTQPYGRYIWRFGGALRTSRRLRACRLSCRRGSGRAREQAGTR